MADLDPTVPVHPGAVGKARGVPMSEIDLHEPEQVATAFGIARAMVGEIEYINDEAWSAYRETPEDRYTRVRAWIENQLK